VKGTIARLISTRGFGFITNPATGEDFFFHASAVENRPFVDLVVGEQVEFEVEPSARGPRACSVVVR
jgi:cold shock protein